MAVSLKHNFVSAKVDSVDATLVQPSNWNAEHTLTLATSSILGRSSAGTGVAQEIPVGTGVFTALGISIGSAGAFVTNTSPTFSGNVTLSSGVANGVLYLNGSLVATSGSALTFDGTNLGIGVTPSAWGGGFKALQMNGGSLSINANGPYVNQNAIFDAVGWKYVVTGAAAQYHQVLGQHFWFTAPSGTAGNAISFTQAMTLDASGNLGVGTTSFSYRLQVQVPAGAQNIFLAGQTGISNGYQITSNGTALTYQWFNTSSEAMRLDASGNLGIGVTPSAWTTGGTKAVQLPGGSVVGFTNGSNNNQVLMLGNCFFNTPGNPVYINSDFATYYRQYAGEHVWFTAPSGTAGNLITFTQAMTLSASGNLGVGTTSPSNLLTLGGNSGGIDFANWNNDRIVFNHAFNASFFQRIVFDAATRDFRIQSNSSDSTAKISFWTGASGTVTERMRLDASGNLIIGTAALATTATAGFPWIPSCAGVPTGAPTAPYTNAAAMVVDTTNNRLYVRVGTTWRFVTLT